MHRVGLAVYTDDREVFGDFINIAEGDFFAEGELVCVGHVRRLPPYLISCKHYFKESSFSFIP